MKKITYVLLTLSLSFSCRTSPEDESEVEALPSDEIVLKYKDGFSSGRSEKKTQVRALQKQLTLINYPLTADGFYGDDTVVVIKKYQNDKNISVAGSKNGKNVSKGLFNSIFGITETTPPPPTTTLSNGKTIDAFKYIIKTSEKRKGMSSTSEPIYWYTSAHQDLYKLNYGSEKAYYKVYSDLWTVKSMQKTMADLAKLGVVGINHFGSYNYRVINGSGKLSRHSYGLAFDILGFYMSDGRYLNILKDWQVPQNKVILKSLRDVFCKHWDVVLSPDHNYDHKDHFHVDLDPVLRNTYNKNTSPSWNSLPSSLNSGLGLTEIIEQEAPERSLHGEIDYDKIEAEMDKEALSLTTTNSTRAFCR